MLQTDYEARLYELREFSDDVVVYAQAGGADFMERFYACYDSIGSRVAREIYGCVLTAAPHR